MEQGTNLYLEKNNFVTDTSNHLEDFKATNVHFVPPLNFKRYYLAATILKELNIKSVIDFGCSECNFVNHLINVPCLELVALVDVDKELLVSKQRNIKPELRHFLFKRDKPLHISLFAGSATDVDARCANFEAVTMIELIEHLHPDILMKVTHNVFSNLKPKICVVTTPNSEFNVLFKKSMNNGFRHWDHKFEWNRDEFKTWCEDVCMKYNYSVEYSGVGLLPDSHTHHLGFCTQAAIFCCKSEIPSTSATEYSQSYELIAEADFPYENDLRTIEEKIDSDIIYAVKTQAYNMLNYNTDFEFEDAIPIKVSSLMKFPGSKYLCCDENAIYQSLQRCGYKLSEDRQLVYYVPEGKPEEDCDDDDNNSNESVEENSGSITELSHSSMQLLLSELWG